MLLNDKVCLVTGATNGIGLVAITELARQGALVYGVGRDPGRASQVEAEVRRLTGNPQVKILLADLASQAAVRHLAAEFRAISQAQHAGRLDLLVNNAGAFFPARQTSADGYEMTLALNHLNYFLLTNLLQDLLLASAPARIVNVASEAQQGARLNLDRLAVPNGRGYNGWQAYANSKLMNIMFTYELARRLANTGVTANVLHPGFVATNFMPNIFRGWLSPLRPLAERIQRRVALTPEQGADTLLYLATSPEVAGLTGLYFSERRPLRSLPISYDEAACRKLWQISAQLAGITP